MFLLHPRLEADAIFLGDLPLCRLLLMNDVRYPWCLLVPRRDDLQEVYQLDEAEQQQLWRESAILGQGMMDAFGGDKLNLAALGNLVPQLHLHHIVRYRDDEAWPGPVWGVGTPQGYSEVQRAEVIERLRSVLPREWLG
jgi:diadenosine tetraphosphate (Ap4A) HIT family hydrolase